MIPRLILAAALAPLLLGGCAGGQASQASDADAASCAKNADAAYVADNEDAYSRTLQNGVRYSATPNLVFDSQRMGDLHARDSQVTRCEQLGAASADAGPPPPPPHIVQ